MKCHSKIVLSCLYHTFWEESISSAKTCLRALCVGYAKQIWMTKLMGMRLPPALWTSVSDLQTEPHWTSWSNTFIVLFKSRMIRYRDHASLRLIMYMGTWTVISCLERRHSSFHGIHTEAQWCACIVKREALYEYAHAIRI